MILQKKTLRINLLGIVASISILLFSLVGIGSSQEIIDETLVRSSNGDLVVLLNLPSWEDLIPNRGLRDTFVSNTEVGVAMVDLSGHFIRVNRSLTRILGYSEQELLSMSFIDVTHPQDKAFDIASCNTLIADPARQSFLMLKKYVRKNNEVINCLLEVFIQMDDQGEPIYFISKVFPIDSRIIQTADGTKLINKKEENFYEFFKGNLPWIITSFLAALSFSILIGRNLQKQIEFNKQIKSKLDLDES